MHILLINNNLVVSRLLSLCTRDTGMVLEEVERADMIQKEKYDIVFIDEGSYAGDVLNLSDMIDIGTKVLLSNAEVEISDFDMTVKKPFLPSEIIEILEHTKKNEHVDGVGEESIPEVDTQEPTIFPLDEKKIEVEEVSSEEDTEYISSDKVLDSNEIDKIKELLEMDDEISEEELCDETYEARKIEAIKEQLIAEGLEIINEEEIVEVLSETKHDDASVMTVFSSVEEEITKNPKKKNKKKTTKNKKKNKNKKKKKTVSFSTEELEKIEDAVQMAIVTLKRKQMKKLLKGKEIEVTIKLEGND